MKMQSFGESFSIAFNSNSFSVDAGCVVGEFI